MKSIQPMLLCAAAAFAVAESERPQTPAPDPHNPAAATARARLLHAACDGPRRVMHRDFLRKGDNMASPGWSLKDVFKTIAEEYGVTLRWLA
jgi:hypothetical protein